MSHASLETPMHLTRRKKAVMATLSLVFLALAAEGGARLLFRIRGLDPASLVLSRHDPGMKVEGRYVSHPFLPFALRPSSEYDIVWTRPPWPELAGSSSEPHRWHVAHNRWGFRGRETTIEKPPNTLRVVCLGGSTTYDTATDGRTWPEKLERLLARAHPDRDVRVLNFGMNASSLPFQITTLALLAVHFEPDLVILYPGHNDLWAGLGLRGFRPDYSHRLGHWDDSRRSLQRRVPAWAMKSVAVTGLVVALDRWRGIKYDLVRQIWRNAPPAANDLEGIWAFQRGLSTVQGIAQVHGARYMLITPFWAFRKNDRIDRFVEHIRQTASEAGIPLFDAARVIPSGDASLVVDDVHFSDKGGTLFAERLAEFIETNRLLLATGSLAGRPSRETTRPSGRSSLGPSRTAISPVADDSPDASPQDP